MWRVAGWLRAATFLARSIFVRQAAAPLDSSAIWQKFQSVGV
jgi:hypothetical protein